MMKEGETWQDEERRNNKDIIKMKKMCFALPCFVALVIYHFHRTYRSVLLEFSSELLFSSIEGYAGHEQSVISIPMKEEKEK